jgi:RHS repeat-associated protein
MEVEKNSGGTLLHTSVYYPAGGAVRVDNTLSYILGDQLGSASLTLSSGGAVTGQTRYYPFGETRVSTGSMPTDRLFTGQRAMLDLGIYHYNARFYSPSLRRFLSADTILPDAGNSQSFSRYSYVGNNPLIHTDPSGHCPIGRYSTGCENLGGSGFLAAVSSPMGAGWGRLCHNCHFWVVRF